MRCRHRRRCRCAGAGHQRIGRGFCAGQDLTDKGRRGWRTCRDTVERYYNPVVRQIRSLNLPVIAAVNGIAAGAGMSLALAADITLANERCVRSAFARIGLIPDAGGTYQLQRLLGPARAMALAMLGESHRAKRSRWAIWRAVLMWISRLSGCAGLAVAKAPPWRWPDEEGV
jgi:2-(1,2-epoxy-1,2-dihydrophenyl)acetyl-CoA isomerase